MQLGDDRDSRRDSRSGLVDGCQVVEMQRIEFVGPDGRQGARPGRHLTLVRVVVQDREHPVRGAGAVLEGRMHRRRPGRGMERVWRGDRHIEGHGMHVEAGVEARRVAEGPDVAPRAREDGHVPAVSRELQRERASDVRRAATWGEEERAEDATTTHEPSVSVS
jgi:hypothetical protein